MNCGDRDVYNLSSRKKCVLDTECGRRDEGLINRNKGRDQQSPKSASWTHSVGGEMRQSGDKVCASREVTKTCVLDAQRGRRDEGQM